VFFNCHSLKSPPRSSPLEESVSHTHDDLVATRHPPHPGSVRDTRYTDSPQVELEPSLNYGGSFLISTVQAFQQQDQAAEGPREELRQYLKTGIESTTDIIAWWGVSLILFWI
jgi:hypothetical protein